MEGILYSTWGRKFKKYHGTIDDPHGNCLTNFWITDPPPKSSKYKFLVHKNPGTVYNKSVWLEEEDDERAIKLLISAEQRAGHEAMQKFFAHCEMEAILTVELRQRQKKEKVIF